MSRKNIVKFKTFWYCKSVEILKCYGGFMKKIIMMVTILFLCSAVGVYAESDNIKIDKIVLCRNVVDRSPQGAGTSFLTNVGNIFCFTDLSLKKFPAEIFHVWYRGDKEMARVRLEARGKTWRTWSSKSVLASWDGDWRVEIEDIDGNVLATKKFSLVNASEYEQSVY